MNRLVRCRATWNVPSAFTPKLRWTRSFSAKRHDPYSQQTRIAALRARYNRVYYGAADSEWQTLELVGQGINRTWMLATHETQAVHKHDIDMLLNDLEQTVEELEHKPLVTLSKVQQLLAKIEKLEE